jgi:hypothetical protein
MARTVASLPAGSRITDYIGLGVVAKFFPVEKVHEVLLQAGRASVRQCYLPAHVTGSPLSTTCARGSGSPRAAPAFPSDSGLLSEQYCS